MKKIVKSIQTEYKGCIYQYKPYVGYDSKVERHLVVLMKITPIDPNNKVIYVPPTLDGKKIRQYDYSILNHKSEYELVVEEGIDYFHMGWFHCKLLGLTLPKTLKTFYTDVFDELRLYLKKIVVDKDNPDFDSRNNCNCLIETKTNKLILIGIDSEIPDGVNELGARLFENRHDLEHLNIPSSVTIIGQETFGDCWLPEDFVLPNSIKKIGGGAFSGARNFTELNFPNIEVIEPRAFSYCKTLQKITFGNNLKVIGDSAFHSCDELKELTLPDSITTLAPGAFAASNIKTIHCSESVAKLIAKTKASTKIKLVIDNNEKTSVGDLLNQPDNVFNLDVCIKKRKSHFAKNINIDMVIQYGSSYESGMPQSDGYNYYDYKDTVIGTLQGMPVIDALSFNKEILAYDDGRETVLHTLHETFEYDGVYSDFITLASTNIFNYLKYKYDETNDVYYVSGFKNIRSVGYLALGFGKEKIIISSNAFAKRNIINIHIGPNVIAIMEDAFPNLTNSIISICEGVDYIAPHAFTLTNGYFKYGGKSIPTSWSNKWNQHNRVFYRVVLDQKELKLSHKDLEDKINNYNKYVKVKWDNDYQKENYEDLFQYSAENRDKLVKMISLDDSFIQKIPEAFKNDPHIFLAAICKNPKNFQYAGDELKKNKNFILEVMEKVWHCGDFILPYIDPSLFNNLDFMTQLIKSSPKAVKFLGKKLKDNKDLWRMAMKKDQFVLDELRGPLRKDREFAREAIAINGTLIRCFAPEIRNDREFAIQAIKVNGGALGVIDKSLGLHDDKEVILMAVASNPYSIRLASDRLKKDEDVALLAVKTDYNTIEKLHKDFLSNKDFILKAMNILDKDDRSSAFDVFLDCMDESLEKNRAFMKELKKSVD